MKIKILQDKGIINLSQIYACKVCGCHITEAEKLIVLNETTWVCSDRCWHKLNGTYVSG